MVWKYTWYNLKGNGLVAESLQKDLQMVYF